MLSNQSQNQSFWFVRWRELREEIEMHMHAMLVSYAIPVWYIWLMYVAKVHMKKWLGS